MRINELPFSGNQALTTRSWLGIFAPGGAMRWLLVILLPLALPAAVQAQFTFTTNGGMITITGYTGTNSDVVIPDTIDGLPVTSIGNGAFFNKTNLTSVTIPGSVTSIGGSAFSLCSSLTSITVDASNSVYSSLEGVLLNKSQTTLIKYPPGKAEIAYTIPNSVTRIGNAAFSDCSKLNSVTIPDSVTDIGDTAFLSCYSLTAITVDALNSAYSSVEGVLFNNGQTTLIKYPPGKAGIAYTIPNSVTRIGIFAFADCSILASVTIPNSVTSIEGAAFAFCTNLTEVTIPDSVTSIENVAFSDCYSLTSITIPNSVTNIGDKMFSDCYSLTNVTIPNSVTKIREWTFEYCISLTGVTIPNSVTRIEAWAFYGCSSLTILTIPNSVTYIGDWAFYSCTNLTGVYFQGNAPSVGLNVFHGDTNATAYYLPGTTGWTNPWQDRPTALWLPQAQTSDANFGVQSNQFGFNVTWASGQTVVVEAATNLTDPVWTPLQTNTLTGDAFYFSDPHWTNHPGRFYRLSSP